MNTGQNTPFVQTAKSSQRNINPIVHLVCNEVIKFIRFTYTEVTFELQNVRFLQESIALIQKTAELLKEKGCDLHTRNKEGLTPTMVALRCVSIFFLAFFITRQQLIQLFPSPHFGYLRFTHLAIRMSHYEAITAKIQCRLCSREFVV